MIVLFGRTLQTGAQESHYLSMVTALTLPALGVAAAAVIRRWRYAAPVVVLAFLVGVPGNLSAMTSGPSFQIGIGKSQRALMVGAAWSPLATQVSGDVHPDVNILGGHYVTMDFLLRARAQGRMPPARPMSPALENLITSRLSLAQGPAPSQAGATATCTSHSTPITVETHKGEVFLVQDPVAVSRRIGSNRYSPKVPYSPSPLFPVVTAEVSGLILRIGPVPPATSFRWCPGT